MKKTTKKVLMFGVFGAVLIFWGTIVFLWLVWPNLIEIKQSLLHFSGDKCSVGFICPATEVASFELCFDDETYVPKFTGVMQLFKSGNLLQEMNVSGFHIANGFRGGNMIDKKRYCIEFQLANEGTLEDVMERNKEYKAIFIFSEPIPRVLLIYTCVDFKSNLKMFMEKREKSGNKIGDLIDILILVKKSDGHGTGQGTYRDIGTNRVGKAVTRGFQ